jgi:hypothetical protein
LSIAELAQFDRRERYADVNVVVVVGLDEGGGPEVHQRDDLRGAHGALEQEQILDHRLGDRPWPLMPGDRDSVDSCDVHRRAV